MQIEPQNPAEMASQSVSNESKKPGRGGRRKGAGRKPNLAKQLLKGFTPGKIALAVQDMDIVEVLLGLLKSTPRIVTSSKRKFT